MKTRHLTRAAYGLAAAILGITLMVGAPLLGVGLLVGVVFNNGFAEKVECGGCDVPRPLDGGQQRGQFTQQFELFHDALVAM